MIHGWRRSFRRGGRALAASLSGVAAAGVCALSAPAPAQAAVTVGSPMTAAFHSGTLCSFSCTLANELLPEPGATATSPIDGVVVRWRVLDAAGTLKLRVLHPAGPVVPGVAVTGSGTSSPESPPSLAAQTYSTALPIHAGDLIALDGPEGSAIGSAAPAGSGGEDWVPPLANGETRTASDGGVGEFSYNADVETDADHDVFGDETQDECVGTAGTFNGCPSMVTINGVSQQGKKPLVNVTATVPGQGKVSAGASNDPTVLAATAKKKKKKKKKKPLIALTPVSETITAKTRQQLVLTLALTKPAKSRLKKKGKLGVGVKVAYTPTGGSTATQFSQVTLKVKKKKKKKKH